MSVPAPLRLVVSRAENAPPLDGALAWRPAPPHMPSARETTFLVAAAATLAVHAAVLAWMAIVPADDAARSAGAATDLILLEGIPVEMVTSLPAPEAPPAEAAPEKPSTTEEPPPEPLPAEPETVAAPPPADPTLPTAEAETGELPARSDEPLPAAEPPPKEALPPEERTAVDEPPPEGPPPPEDSTEAEPPAPDPATMPTPRTKPDRTEVAETRPEPAKPATPPPSAPSAPASAARSGGAGGGGAGQTAGNATASSYRAEVAARLAKKRFYPNAARRDRLTGRATVSFTLNASGRVTAARILRSAGSRILDEAALEMVQRAAPYPRIPSGLGTTITIQAPIGFELPR